MTKILHLTMNPITTEGGYSQRIIRQIELFENIDNIEVFVLNFNSIKYISKKNLQKFSKVKTRLEKENVKEIKLKLKLPGPLSKIKEEFGDHYYVRIILNYIKKHSIDLVYAENLFAAYFASIIKKDHNINYIMDYHGVSPEEMIEFSDENSSNRYEYLKRIERQALQNAKFVICVSHVFKNYLIKEFQINKLNIFVIPSCITLNHIEYDTETREQIRKKLSIENKRVLIYAGGTGLWHCFDEMVKVFNNFYKYDKSFYFLVLVGNNNIKNIPELIGKFSQYGLPLDAFKIQSVEHKHIKKYYMASDYGIIVRSNSLVNRVASPTKIPEYLSTGLSLISTNNIGDVEKIPGNKILFNYDDINKINGSVIETLTLSREENFGACKEYLINNYIWENMQDTYEKIFINRL